jgi:tRNA 2-thiouridine synthesizing protein A
LEILEKPLGWPLPGAEWEGNMLKTVDARGLKCPQPTLMMLTESLKSQKGDILEVVADCPTFEHDVREFCATKKKALLWIKVEGTAKRCQVQL